MHHRLASSPVRCDLVLYEDNEIVIILSLSFIRKYVFCNSLSLSPKKIACIGLCFIIALFV